MNKALVAVFFLVWATVSCPAQSGLVFPKGNIACILDIRPHYSPPLGGGESQLPAHPIKAEIVRTGELTYIRLTSSNAKITEVWKPGKFDLTFFSESDQARLKVRRGDDYLPSVFQLDRDRSWFEWTNSNYFKEEVTYRGIKCARYEKRVSLPALEGGGAPRSALYQLWVDISTSLPVAFDDEDTRYDITFKTAPAELKLPAGVQHEIKEYEALLTPAKRRGT